MQAAADTTGDPAQGCSHNHSHNDDTDGAEGEHSHSSHSLPEKDQVPTKPLPLPKWSTKRHIQYFLANLRELPAPYTAADSNRMTLVFFCVSALDILGVLVGPAAVVSSADRTRIVDWIYANQVVVPEGASEELRAHAGFIGGTFMGTPFRPTTETEGGSLASTHNFAHIAMTYTALATLAILGDDFSRVRREDILFAIGKLQRPDGMFMSTVAGSEADMRFVYCAATVCKMLGDFSAIDVERSVKYIARSQTYDGSFGLVQDQEAHGGSTFCAVASLKLMDKLDRIPRRDDLVDWCIARQVGGFQGRRNKDPDTCYSFWVGATLQILGEFDKVDNLSNSMFHASCQFMYGGFSKFPSVYPDLLHSFFSTCFLSMKGHDGFGPINEALCISTRANDTAPWSGDSATVN